MNDVTFSSQCDALASQVGASQLTFVVKGLIIAREAGATNKKAARGLWATVSDETSNALSVLKRINGGLNTPSDKATESQKALRALWIGADNAEDFLSGLAGHGIKTAKDLQVLACPAKEAKEPTAKSAVETFLSAAMADGFKEDLTPLLVWLAEGASLPQMLDVAQRATVERAGREKDAAEAHAKAKAQAEAYAAAKAAQAAQAEAAKALLIEAGLYTEGLLAAV